MTAAEQQVEQREHVEGLVRIVRHHTGDATPRGVDQGATVSRRGLATVAVANGPLAPPAFRKALRGALEHRHLVRFTWGERQRFTLPEARLLRRVQRETGQRGDRETVAKAHQVLEEVA
jgi:hypothetical protein